MSELKYIQVSNEIRFRIESGLYQYGSKIPTEKELAEELGVNRLTVRKGLHLLQEEGLITSSRGRGTFVSNRKIDYSFDFIEGTSSFFTDLGLKPTSKLLRTEKRKAGSCYSKALRISPDDDIYQIVRLRFGDGVPLALEYSTLPFHTVPCLDTYDFSLFSLYEIFDKNNISPSKSTSVFSIVKLGELECELLMCQPGEYGFLLEEYLQDEAGHYIEFSRSFYSARKFNFSSENF